MIQLDDVCQYMESFASTRLAEEWDNVGLLIGDRRRQLKRVMTCLTITPESLNEAIVGQVDLIITHHPFPFRPLKKITADTSVGDMLLQLIRANIAVYSPHTAFDSAVHGINQSIAEGLGLREITPLKPAKDFPSSEFSAASSTSQFENSPEKIAGSGRSGKLVPAMSGVQFIDLVKQFFQISGCEYSGPIGQSIRKVGVACGAAGELLELALNQGCDAFLIGETNFHTCLEARARNCLLVLPGHFATERFALVRLAQVIASAFPGLTVWASREESDPVERV
jgi:dinuclear metal center YbgI/SA1388 family protein